MRRLYDMPSCKPVISCITDASEARRIPLTLTVKRQVLRGESRRAVLAKKETVVKHASTRRSKGWFHAEKNTLLFPTSPTTPMREQRTDLTESIGVELLKTRKRKKGQMALFLILSVDDAFGHPLVQGIRINPNTPVTIDPQICPTSYSVHSEVVIVVFNASPIDSKHIVAPKIKRMRFMTTLS